MKKWHFNLLFFMNIAMCMVASFMGDGIGAKLYLINSSLFLIGWEIVKALRNE